MPVLLKISDVFGVDASFFANQDTTRLIAELSEVVVDADMGVRTSTGEITELATGQPEIARALVTLHRR